MLVIFGFCTHHAHTRSCEPGFGFTILVHQQLSTGVTNNQLIQLQQRQAELRCMCVMEREKFGLVLIVYLNMHLITNLDSGS